MILPFTANALSATTANTIQGTKPALSFDGGASVAENLNKLLSFKMPDGSGSEIEIDMTQSDAIHADPNFTFDQFKALVVADGKAKNMLASYYYDEDGDVPDVTTPVSGTLTATWSYKMPDGVTVKTLEAADLTGKFDACNAPYTLTIKADNVNVKSRYGNPRTNSYTNTSQSYTVNVTDYKMCYANPRSTKQYPAEQAQLVSQPNPIAGYGGGYTSDFVPYAGFKATASTKFPTTGFAKAQFQLKMSNAQSDYTYSVPTNPGGFVEIDNLGNVMINDKPTGPITLRAIPNISGYPTIDYQFTIGLWVVPKGGSSVVANTAISMCGGSVNNLLTLAELTNSPYSTTSIASGANPSNAFTRAIGKGVFSEWGYTDNLSYPNTQWNGGFYWSSRSRMTNVFYGATSSNGSVFVDPWDRTWVEGSVVCRG